MKYLIFAFAFYSVFAAQAAVNIDPTAYPTLKAAFEHAQPARLEDYPNVYDLNTERSPLKCVLVCDPNIKEEKCYLKNSILPTLIGKYNKLIPGKPAKPGNGPLLPGTPAIPDTYQTLLIPALHIAGVYNLPLDENRVVTNDEINGVFARSKIENLTIKGDLTSVTTSAVKTSTTTYRKKNGQLIFRQVSNFEAYGYCY